MAVILALVEGSWISAAVLIQAVGLSLCCCIISLYIGGLYDLRISRGARQFASRLPRSLGVAVILLAVLYPLFPAKSVSSTPFVSSLIVMVALLLPMRAISYKVMRSRPFLERVLILGMSPLAHKLIEEIEARPHGPYAIVGVADDDVALSTFPLRYPFFGPVEHIAKIVEEVHPDRIIVALAERRGRLPIRQLLESRGRGIVVEEGGEAYERLTGKLAFESLAPSSLVFSKDCRTSRLALAIGRGVSLVASVIGLVGLAPLLGVIALAIKLESKGPVFFVQDRVAAYGKRFKLIKFRTMHPDTRTTSEWVRDNVDRITRVGKWLRKFRLDELPQFVNILRGDMNLVGPRPHPVSNFQFFVEKIPYYPLRLGVRPGVTGWAQVRYGYANDLEEETEKMRYDLYYIKHMSIWLDLRILFETVKIILSGRGSGAAAGRLEARREEGLRAA
jgi:exopolysaccharide biosynthesis polyprenyl glycosylphosphotransferase